MSQYEKLRQSVVYATRKAQQLAFDLKFNPPKPQDNPNKTVHITQYVRIRFGKPEGVCTHWRRPPS